MITKMNGMPSQNTFGVKIDKRNVKIDESLSKYSKERLDKVLKEIDAHNLRVANDPLECQDVIELASVNLVSSARHVTDITETWGLHARIPSETIDPHTEKRTFSSEDPSKIVKDLSDYWDRIIRFESQKPKPLIDD